MRVIRTFNSSLVDPYGITTDGRNILLGVASSSGRILTVDKNGILFRNVSAPANPPMSLACRQDANFYCYITSAFNARFLRDRSGITVRSQAIGIWFNATAIDGGYIYHADNSTYIRKYKLENFVLTKTYNIGITLNGLVSDGNFFWGTTASLVYQFNKDFQIIRSAAVGGGNNRDIAFDGNFLYVADPTTDKIYQIER